MTPQEFRDWRTACGLTQGEAGNILGVTGRAVAKWEADQAPIDERTELACKAYLRRHRSIHGFNGVPLLYVVHAHDPETSKPLERYLAVARSEHEAVTLVYAWLEKPPRATLSADAVSDVPPETKPRVLDAVSQMVGRSFAQWI